MNLGDLPKFVILLVVAGIVIGVSGTILQNLQEDQAGNSSSYNATGNALDAIETVSGWQDTIGLVGVAAIVIGLVASAFAIFSPRQE